MTTQVEAPTTFRWDRLTYSSALGYCLLVAGLSVGVVLSELRDEFGTSATSPMRRAPGSVSSTRSSTSSPF